MEIIIDASRDETIRIVKMILCALAATDNKPIKPDNDSQPQRSLVHIFHYSE